MSVLREAPKRLFLGRPMRSSQLSETLLPKKLAMPVFCSDPLSSVAYATEEILLILSLAGLAFLHLAWYVAYPAHALPRPREIRRGDAALGGAPGARRGGGVGHRWRASSGSRARCWASSAHLYAFYDQPELMHRINSDLCDFNLRRAGRSCARSACRRS